MATYGNPNGQIGFTGWSPTLGSVPNTGGSTVGTVQFNGMTQEDYDWSADFSNLANRKFRALLYALVGAVAGGTASASYSRVLAQQAMNNPFALGGLVPIESVSYINRSTLAGDVTNIKALLDRDPGVVAYVPDLSGNGGSAGIAKVLW